MVEGLVVVVVGVEVGMEWLLLGWRLGRSEW